MEYTVMQIVDITFIFIFIILTTINAFAYIDPGSGSYMFQIIAAGMFGILFAVKMFWTRISGLIRKLISRGKKLEE